MCDIEQLIIAIEKFPCLWTIHEDDYHNRDSKDAAWEEVSKDIFTDWESLDEKEKKMKCADLKKKWTNVRDCYRKDVQKSKNTPSGSAAKKQKRYVYADVLSFLAPVFDSKHSDGNYTNLIETQNSTEEDKENNAPPQTASVPGKTSSTSQIKEKKKDVPTQILDLLHQRNQSRINSTDDDDTKFLLSFRSDSRKMNTRDKLDFKIGMLQLAKKFCKVPSPTPSSYLSTPGPQMVYIQNPTSSTPYYTSTPNPSTQIPNSRVIINSIASYILPPLRSTEPAPSYLPPPRDPEDFTEEDLTQEDRIEDY